jgi:YD repeat-containing protein
MKRLALWTVASVLVAAPTLLAQGSTSPYYEDTFGNPSQTNNNWTINGSASYSSLLIITSASGASLISKIAVPDGTSQYQATINGTYIAGGGYTLYLEATSNALLNPVGASTGTFYAFVITQTGSGSGCSTAQATLYKTVSGAVTQISSTSVPCSGTYSAIAANDGSIRLQVLLTGNTYYEPIIWTDSAPLKGQPGIGAFSMPSGAEIMDAFLSGCDRVAPSSIDPSTVKTYVLPTEVDIRSGASLDNTGGVGFYEYQWYRNGQYLGATPEPEYRDLTVSAGSTYSYAVVASDFDGNNSPQTTFSVKVPSNSTIDPRQVGVRPIGSYWGALGEQIDARSGNLNFSYPLLTAISRGWSVPLQLSYNSQTWRLDSGNNAWNLGFDSGYGYGWTLQFGSITPYYSSLFTVALYQFVDASGAIYRLDQNNNGLWTSKESTYVTFDANTQILHFNDGSHWLFKCVSGGLEPDAGTMYPVAFEDSNGNEILVQYESGKSDPVWVYGSSARIYEIADVRAVGTQPLAQPTYTFTYDSNNYLTSIANNIGTGESFSFTYSPAFSVTSPFSASALPETVKTLNSITNTATNFSTSFSYASSNDGEMIQATLPYGGHIRWQYANTAYTQATVRGVASRYLLWDSTIGERTFTFSRTTDGSGAMTASTQLNDVQANASKKWSFNTAAGATQGLISTYQEERTSDQTVFHQVNYSWTQDANGNNYISRTQDIMDPGTTYAATKQVDQTMDQYGNVTQTKLYALNSLTTPAKIYTNTYLSGSNYAADYIYNRLLSSTVSDGNQVTWTLVTNTYDSSSLASAPNATLLDTTVSAYRGNVTSSTSFTHVTNKQYDVTGTVVYTNDGNANHSTTITNATSVNYAAPSALTAANSQTTSYTWSNILAPLSTTGPNGDATTTSYDPSTARPTQQTSAYGSTTTYTYSNTAPQVTATVNGGAWTKTYLDGLGRTYRVAAGNGTTTISYTDTAYDACGCTPQGKMYKTSMPYVPGNTPAWQVYTYDALGRIVTATAPDGAAVTSYNYAGNTVTATDPAGKWKQYTMDAFGQLTQVVEESPNGKAEPNHVTTYTYDLLGHLVQAQMPRTISGQVVTQNRTWTYDSTTQLLSSATTPESGTTTYSYNSDGTLATRTDQKSQQIRYSYDAYGRMIQISRGTLNNGVFTENTAQRTTLAYDGTNGGFSANTTGRVSQINYSGPHGLQFTELYSYHSAGAVTAKRLSISGAPLGSNTANADATYTYNNLGQVVSVQYPFTQWSNGAVLSSGPQYGYTYDTMNRLAGMTGPNNSHLVTSVTYGAANQVLQLNANTFSQTISYNANLQVTELTAGSYHYRYNYSSTQNNGRVVSTSDVLSGETITYQYDTLNRLIQASGTGDAQGAWSQAFTFDGFGNLIQKTGSNAPSNALLATNSQTNHLSTNGAQYDSNGNLTAYGTGSYAVTYAYDIENRLSSATPVGSIQHLFGYDSANQRIYQGTYNTSSGAYSNETIYYYGADNRKLAA